jgi:hypothetical protein
VLKTLNTTDPARATNRAQQDAPSRVSQAILARGLRRSAVKAKIDQGSTVTLKTRKALSHPTRTFASAVTPNPRQASSTVTRNRMPPPHGACFHITRRGSALLRSEMGAAPRPGRAESASADPRGIEPRHRIPVGWVRLDGRAWVRHRCRRSPRVRARETCPRAHGVSTRPARARRGVSQSGAARENGSVGSQHDRHGPGASATRVIM